ncbi:MAG: putative amidohydrolase YtcJ [Glaciecola sp.]|jgi:predicted amidohydrolase YtcJ
MTQWLLREARLQDPRFDGHLVDVRVHDGAIVEVGVDLAGAGEDVFEVAGRRLLPGLRDAHVHLLTWARTRATAALNEDLLGAHSATEAAKAVAEARGTPGVWLLGTGFRQASWPSDPHKSLLDAAAPDSAVVLTSQDQHSSWWSSAALAEAGFEHETGYLREYESWDALERIPAPTMQQDDAAVHVALTEAAARGVTSIVDYEFSGALWQWRRRDQAASLPIRVTSGLVLDELAEALDGGWRTGDVDGMVTIGSLKLFADGALGSRTAWCDHAFVDDDNNHGRALMVGDEMASVLQRAAAGALSATVHAIGDAANRLVLDAFAATGVRGSIEHAQLLAEADLARIAALTRTVSVQPSHAVDDRDLADRWWADRVDRAYPLASLLKHGAKVVFGSDAPVAPLDPWMTIAAAVARTLDDLPPWQPSQAVSLDQALQCSTSNLIAVGQPADLIVTDVDPFSLESTELAEVTVAATMAAGGWTHHPELEIRRSED